MKKLLMMICLVGVGLMINSSSSLIDGHREVYVLSVERMNELIGSIRGDIVLTQNHINNCVNSNFAVYLGKNPTSVEDYVTMLNDILRSNNFIELSDYERQRLQVR